MSRRTMLHAAIAAAGLLGVSASANAADALTIDSNALDDCFGQSVCNLLPGAVITTTGGQLANKALGDDAGFGVSGGASGGEIDVGQNLRVDFNESRGIIGIQILFLFNGPEFSDRAEIAQVSADGTAYTLKVRNDFDDDTADWSGPGTVSKCGDTTSSGTGCFLITDPFPGAVSRLDFTAIEGGPPAGGPGTNDSDYSIGYIDVAADVIVNLDNCAGTTGCPVASVGGSVAASFSSMQSAGGSTETTVIPVVLPDCRYIPMTCVDLLPPEGDYAANDNAAREILIGLGVIKPLVATGPNRYLPAAQLLNVKPLLPPEVLSMYNMTATPPGGLPSLYISSRWRGQQDNGYWFEGLFFKTDAGLVFSDTFEGLIDVSTLTGSELGCVAVPGDLLAWDVITTVSELAKSVGGRYIDTMINVGCINPTKVSGTRLSLYSVNMEMVPDTFAPTIKSFSSKFTANNDAVFARLVQSLWHDIGETRASYACKQADPVPAGGVAPLSSTVCKKLASRWAVAEFKVNLCVIANFYPASSYRTWICGLARDYVDAFEAALPVAATGPDAYNRLGELKARVDVFQHVWDERFLNSQKPDGFCSERGNCAP